MKRALCVVCVAGLVSTLSTARGEVNTRVDILVSSDGLNFSSHALMVPNSGRRTFEVLVRMTYIGPRTDVAGFASAVFQPTVSNFGGTDVALGYANGGAGSNTSSPPGVVADAPGQYGRISPWGRTAMSTTTAISNHLHSGGSGGAPAGSWLRIAQRQVTAWIGGTGNTTGGSGVNVAQLANVGRTAADPAFNSSLSVNVFRFGIQLDTNLSDRILVIDAPLNGFGNRNSATGEREVYWWSQGGLNGSSGDIRGTAIVNTAVIGIPAPAGALALGVGGWLLARRRRAMPNATIA
jgi:hypothetical protein